MWRLSVVLAVLIAGTASGTSIDPSPRPTLWLATGEFIAQDTMHSVSLYDQKGTSIRRFQAGPMVQVAATSDEKFLLLACADGSLKMFDLRTGETIWAKTPKESGLGFIHDASFAWNGGSVIACDDRGEAVIFETTTGKQIGAVRSPMQARLISAALSPDGSKGVLVDLSERVFTFDTATGKPVDTGLRGGWPIRFSSTGKHFALSSSSSGVYSQLRVVTADSKSYVDAGDFGNIGHIKPLSDGRFVVTATASDRTASSGLSVAGAVCDPDRGSVVVRWKMPGLVAAAARTDFDPQKMIGVSTDYLFVTSVVDLQNLRTLLTIDNSANFPQLDSETSSGYGNVVGRGILVLVGGVVLLIVVRLMRRKLVAQR